MLGILAVFFAVAWLVDSSHLARVSVEGVAAIGLMFLGAALIVTGRTDWGLSRRAWPVWLGLGLVVVLIASSGSFGLDHAGEGVTFGSRSVTPTGTFAQLPAQIHGGFGALTVDLSHVKGTLHRDRTVDVVSLAGRIRVAVPPGTRVHLDARVVGGVICVDGHAADHGLNARADEDLGPHPGADSNQRTLTLDVRQAFGRVDVGQGSSWECR